MCAGGANGCGGAGKVTGAGRCRALGGGDSDAVDDDVSDGEESTKHLRKPGRFRASTASA